MLSTAHNPSTVFETELNIPDLALEHIKDSAVFIDQTPRMRRTTVSIRRVEAHLLSEAWLDES